MAKKNDKKLTLADIRPPQEPPSAIADADTQRELNALEVQRKREELSSYIADTAARGVYSNRIFFLVVGWIVAVFVILLLQGFRWFCWQPLSDNVVLMLVGGSAVSIIGLLASVIAYIFRIPK